MKKALKFAKNGTKRDVENAAVYVNILDRIIYLLEKNSHSVNWSNLDDSRRHQHLHGNYQRELAESEPQDER